MKIKQTIHVHFSKWDFEETGEYVIYSHKFEDTDFRAHICECEIEIEIPDDFDPRPQQIAALEQKKQEAMAEYQNTLTEINERISRLQAITYTKD
jgi:hypothetical protein